MTTANLAPTLKQSFFDANGNPLSGGKLYSYQAGTTTPQATYTDQGAGSTNANPVILDLNGQANVWLNPSLSYRFDLYDSSNVLQWSVDDVIGTLINNAVGTDTLQDNAVTSPKIADSAVTLAKLAGQAFGPDALLNCSLAAAVATSNLTITLKDGTGGIPDASSPAKVAFRSATAATGVPVFRNVTSAITGTVLSGSTLGSTNAKANWIYVYLIDNGGAVEFAWSASKRFDDGTLQNTTADAGTATSKYAIYSNIARTGVAVRLIGRIKSTQATAGTWATAPSEIAVWPFENRTQRSEVAVRTGNGYGGTNLNILRYTTVTRNFGSAITYADSAANGASFTINEDGVYSISMVIDPATATDYGPTLNAVTIAAVTDPALLAAVYAAGASTFPCVAVTLALFAGDIIYPWSGVAVSMSDNNYSTFRIAKVSD